MMVVPTMDGTSVTGVKVLDVTDGLNAATVVPTLGATLAEAQNTEGLNVNTGATVNGADLDLFLIVGNQFTRFTREQTVVTVRGDLDNNGVVDVTDVNLAINALLTGDSSLLQGNADLDENGVLDVSDINTIINLLLGN